MARGFSHGFTRTQLGTALGRWKTSSSGANRSSPRKYREIASARLACASSLACPRRVSSALHPHSSSSTAGGAALAWNQCSSTRHRRVAPVLRRFCAGGGPREAFCQPRRSDAPSPLAVTGRLAALPTSSQGSIPASTLPFSVPSCERGSLVGSGPTGGGGRAPSWQLSPRLPRL